MSQAMKKLALISALLCGCNLHLQAQAPVGSLDRLPDPAAMPAPKLVVPKARLEAFTLTNGLRVRFIENHELPVLTMVGIVKAGNAEDPAAQSGLASLTAALLRGGGTRAFTSQELDAQLDGMAATLEFQSELEYSTCYLHCFKQDAARVLGLLDQMLAQPRFAPERLEVKRAQLIAKLKEKEDQPIDATFIPFLRLLYNGRMQGQIPSAATVKAIQVEDLKAFASTWYRPENMVIGLTGDLTLAEARKLLETQLGPWRSGPGPMPALHRQVEPSPMAGKLLLKARPGQKQSVILMGVQGLSAQDPDREALEVGMYILGGGTFSNRLFNHIRTEAGLAYLVQGVTNFPFTVPGFLLGLASTKGEQTVQVVTMMRQELQRLAQDGITAAELAVTQKALANQEIFASATLRDVVFNAAGDATFGLAPDHRALRLDKLQALTVGQVNEALKRRFKPEQALCLVYGDPASFGDLKLEALGPVLPVPEAQ